MSLSLNNRILLVDDNPAIHDDFHKILLPPPPSRTRLEAVETVLFDCPPGAVATTAFDLTSAYQGQEALEKVVAACAEGRPFALAFVDMRMPPGWDGIETIERLWQADPALQVVVCTAYSDYSWEKMTRRLGVNANLVILKKPFDNIEVLQLSHALTTKWQCAAEAQRHAEPHAHRIGGSTAEARRSDQRYDRAFHDSPIPMAIHGPVDNRLVEVNEAFCQLTGHEHSALVGRSPVEAGLISPIPAPGEERPIRHVEAQVSTKAGDLRTALLAAERTFVDDEPHVLLIVLDISERQQLEAQLRQTQKMEAIGQLAAGVAHDFNNLLTIIQGHASLQLSLSRQEDDRIESLQQIALAAERAADLTRQLLAFSRRQVMRPRVIHLGTLIPELSTMLRRLLGEKIELHCDLAEGVPPVWADRTGLEQIIMNLALNARDAMPRGGRLTIATSLRHVTAQDQEANPEVVPGDHVALSFRDTGIGMDADVRARIFEPFFTTKDPTKGTGMGLATVYGTIKQHGGWIELDTEPGTGSQFCVFLPITDRAEEPRAEVDDFPILTALESTILVVEDDEAVRSLVREVLDSNGYRILEAEHGEAALEVWKEHRGQIDLLLTDMVMPGSVNGLELARRILADQPDLKVIYTSGYSAELFDSDVKLEDGRNYLPKPYLSSKLTKIVRQALHSDRHPSK